MPRKTRGAENAAKARFEKDAKDGKLSEDDFDIHEQLGEGGEGDVYLATHRTSGVEVAYKCIREINGWEENESAIHRQLKHPNILGLYGEFRDSNGFMCIITEYCREGTLLDVMSAKFPKWTTKEAKAANAIRHVLQGLKYLRDRGILHRDIKGENVLWIDGVAKLADFGFAVKANHETEFCGTKPFMAPEVLAMDVTPDAEEGAPDEGTEGQTEEKGTEKVAAAAVNGGCYSGEADIWSVGATAFELLMGDLPFGAKENSQEFRHHIHEVLSSHQGIHFPVKTVSDDAKNFIQSILQFKPEDRSSIDEALMHRWIVNHAEEEQPAEPVGRAAVAVADQDNKENTDTVEDVLLADEVQQRQQGRSTSAAPSAPILERLDKVHERVDMMVAFQVRRRRPQQRNEQQSVEENFFASASDLFERSGAQIQENRCNERPQEVPRRNERRLRQRRMNRRKNKRRQDETVPTGSRRLSSFTWVCIAIFIGILICALIVLFGGRHGLDSEF